MSKKIQKLLLIIVSAVILLLLADIGLNLHFKKGFAPNTWINNIYATGRTVDSINKELIELSKVPDIVIIDISGRRYVVQGKDICLQPEFTSEIRKVMKARANYSWIKTLRDSYYATVEPEYYKWDREKFLTYFTEMDFYKEEAADTGTYVTYSEEQGFYLYDGKIDRLNLERARELAESAVFDGNFVIDLKELGCYETYSDSESDKEARSLWEKLTEYYDCGVTLDMGAEKITFTPALLSTFLRQNIKKQPALDENGQLIIEEEAVNAWLTDMLVSYNTADTERDFQTTQGRVVQVKYNNYGTLIDVDAELAYLYDAIANKKREEHQPVYLKEAFYKGKDDIGPTYVEVDMGEQKMYYYQDGELKLSTDVVTGNMKRKFDTPSGINYVEYKQLKRVLVGPGYRTPVDYWIRVVGHIGIHDANWRNEFGGDIYLTNGSHGCVNTPTDKVAELYDMVELGTPVVMFY